MKTLLLVLVLLKGFWFLAAGEYLGDCLSGVHAQKDEHWNEAILHYDVCIEYGELSQENLVNMLNRRGMVYDRQGNHDRAIKDYNKALVLNPKYDKGYTNRGLAYFQKKKYDRAIKDYNKALVLNPKDAYTLTMRGDAYFQKKKYDRAIKDYNKALQFQEHYSIFYARGKAYQNKKKYTQAIQDFKKSLELNPKAVDVKNELDQVLLFKKMLKN